MKLTPLPPTCRSLTLPLAALLVLGASPALAFPGWLNAWQARYAAQSSSGIAAGCQLCHANANGGSPWNAYGWDLLLALDDDACDLDASGTVSRDEAFFCVEAQNSDGDGSDNDNAFEIGLSTQPGWTNGPFNTLYSEGGTMSNEPPPAGIGQLDPDGTEPPPPPPPPPPGEDDDWPPLDQIQSKKIVVEPGRSIQRAIDVALPGTKIYVLSGLYHEYGDATNALSITKDGIQLIGEMGPGKEVVLENAGRQRNGIAVVPDDRTDCMSCHSDMTFPFPILPGVEPGLKMREPMMYGFQIKGFTIRNFNNGLFTENVDGFQIRNVKAIDNDGYGIFPTLSKNGLITNSYASGSDDSGIWVETSENVQVTHNLVEHNVNGFEISNSDRVTLSKNVARYNSVGIASLLLPDIFDDRPGATRIDMVDNKIYDNNKVNTARPGSILSEVPKGIGILHLGVDQSLIARNQVQGHEFVGIGLTDYCLAVATSEDFNCAVDPTITPEFLADQGVTNNRVENNVVVGNGTNPPGGLIGTFAADLTLLASAPNGNCYEGNLFSTFTSFLGIIPAPPPCE
jgi:parallel beta-helix repeat protein